MAKRTQIAKRGRSERKERPPPRPPPPPRRSVRDVADQELLEALTATANIQLAARLLHVDPAELIAHLQDERVRKRLREARIASVEQGLTRIALAMPTAADYLVEMAKDAGPRDSVRIAAVNGVLQLGERILKTDRLAPGARVLQWAQPPPPFPAELDEDEPAAPAPTPPALAAVKGTA